MKLTDTQRKWIERILRYEDFDAGYYHNMMNMLERGEYDPDQRIEMNDHVNPSFIEYLKKRKNGQND